MNENFKKYALMFAVGFLANFAATMLVVHIANKSQQNTNNTLAQKTAAQPPRQVTVTTTEEEGTNA